MQASEQVEKGKYNWPNVSAQIIKIKIDRMLEFCEAKAQPIQQFPEAFETFMKTRGLDINELSIPIPRYVRIKPDIKITTEDLAKDIGVRTEEIVKIDDNFWALNPNAKINHCSLYQSGSLYGMDYSSAMPVRCLDLEEGLQVLQLCSAPGNKSMVMADTFKDISIKGVEINHNRANVMRSLIKKYRLDHKIEVVQADGLKYAAEQPFDRVLIDAECTHEGSLKHIFKFFHEAVGTKQKKKQKLTKQQEKQFKQNNSNPYTSEIAKANQWSLEDFEERFLDAFKLANLNHLQSGLLENGFKLLKPGGILVYSTCSFDYHQNEEIIEKLLNQENEAELMDATIGFKCSVGWREGKIKGTLRFSPSISSCGGMFIAKIRRKKVYE